MTKAILQQKYVDLLGRYNDLNTAHIAVMQEVHSLKQSGVAAVDVTQTDDYKSLAAALDRVKAENDGLRRLVESIKRKNAEIKDANADLLKQIESNPPRQHNERGAGRKAHDAKWQAAYADFVAAYERGGSVAEVCGAARCSVASYYRYRRYYDSQNLIVD